MGRVDSAYMDCVSDVVALLLAHAGVADVRTPFAYQWAFRVVGGIDGVLEPDLPPRARDRSVARLGCSLSPAVQGIRQIGHEGSFGGMWAKLVIDPAAGRGVVWLDNRGEELREQRYRTIRELFDGLGRTDAAGGVSGFGLGLAVEPEAVHGEYVRTGAPPLTVGGREELELTADRDRAVLVPHQRAVWRSADRYGPGAPPWGPHAGTDRIVLGATAWRDGSVPVVHLNGLPYVRQEWRKRLRSRTTGAG
jgi:hypothetical protein